MIAADLMHLLEEGTPKLDRNQIQLALAVADREMLQSLLVNCTPAIAQPRQLGQIRVSIGSPPDTKDLAPIDAVLEYEQMWCMLSEDIAYGKNCTGRDYQLLTRCQSHLKTLAWRVNLSNAIALLSHGGFQEEHIQRILNLPWDGWHRSWWDTLDAQGQIGLSFQRSFRTRRYSDGTYTLQYRDHYSQDAPPCFRGIWQQVPITIAHAGHSFGEVIGCLRQAKHVLNSQHCLLLFERLTDLEAEGYMRQGVHLYPLEHSAFTKRVLCRSCGQYQCPMRGHLDTPVINCRDYVPSGKHN